MRLIIRSDGIPFLVGMATSEHLVMQNESLVSLTLIATSVLGKKTYCFFLKSVHYVYSLCNTSISKCCYGNNNVKVMLYSQLFDTYHMYLFSVTEKKPTEPKL